MKVLISILIFIISLFLIIETMIFIKNKETGHAGKFYGIWGGGFGVIFSIYYLFNEITLNIGPKIYLLISLMIFFHTGLIIHSFFDYKNEEGNLNKSMFYFSVIAGLASLSLGIIVLVTSIINF